MIYLVVGLDRRTLVRWHDNVQARDVPTAELVATSRAEVRGFDLVVAAVIGPHSNVLSAPLAERAPAYVRAPKNGKGARPFAPGSALRTSSVGG
jgi:hypothetical protein